MNTKLILIALIGAFMFTSCEKDDTNEFSQQGTKINSNKNHTINDKSTSSSSLTDFTEAVINGENPGSFESEVALLNLEAAMNFEYNYVIGNEEEYPYIQRLYHVNDIDFNAFGNDMVVGGSDILQLKTDIFNAIDQTAQIAADTIPGNGNLYITTIDIAYNPTADTYGVNFILGRFAAFSISNCNFDGDYFLQHGMGGCSSYNNPGSLTNTDANDMVSAHIANINCNPNITVCPSNGPFVTWYNIETTFDQTQYLPSTYNTIGNHYTTTVWNDCLSENTQASVASSIETWQSNNFPIVLTSGETREIKNAMTQVWSWMDQSQQANYAIKQTTVSGICNDLSVDVRPDFEYW